MRIRKNPEKRKIEILSSAMLLSIEIGYNNLNRYNLAKEIGISETLVYSYFSSIKSLRRTVLEIALQLEIPQIVIQAIHLKELDYFKLKPSLRNKVKKLIIKH